MRLAQLVWLALLLGCNGSHRVVVGSKNFTESVLLGEIVAQQLERHGVAVDRRLNLGGTFICHQGLTTGQLDVYVEYTGTAYSAILQLPEAERSVDIRSVVDSVYRHRWNARWMEPLGFNNTFALLIRGEDARRLNIATMSEAVPHAVEWRFGAGYEFVERADGYRGLTEFYGIRFAGQPVEMDLGLTYRALAERQVDIIAGNSTDGQIDALDLFHLADDRGYFPPYEAAPVVRAETLEQFRSIAPALRQLARTLTDADMRWLNYQVDVERRDVKSVAREFLEGLSN